MPPSSGTKRAAPNPAVFALEAATSVRRSTLFDPVMRISSRRLRCAAEMVAPVAARLSAHALAGRPGERLEGLRCDARPESFQRTLGPLRVSACLIADGLQLGNAVFQHRVGKIGHAIF